MEKTANKKMSYSSLLILFVCFSFIQFISTYFQKNRYIFWGLVGVLFVEIIYLTLIKKYINQNIYKFKYLINYLFLIEAIKCALCFSICVTDTIKSTIMCFAIVIIVSAIPAVITRMIVLRKYNYNLTDILNINTHKSSKLKKTSVFIIFVAAWCFKLNIFSFEKYIVFAYAILTVAFSVIFFTSTIWGKIAKIEFNQNETNQGDQSGDGSMIDNL